MFQGYHISCPRILCAFSIIGKCQGTVCRTTVLCDCASAVFFYRPHCYEKQHSKKKNHQKIFFSPPELFQEAAVFFLYLFLCFSLHFFPGFLSGFPLLSFFLLKLAFPLPVCHILHPFTNSVALHPGYSFRISGLRLFLLPLSYCSLFTSSVNCC